MHKILHAAFVAILLTCAISSAAGAAASQRDDLRAVVDRTILPVMKHYGIPGMAVGLAVRGRHEVFNYGVASTATRTPVDRHTLFEIGSISKTFTASLVSYAQRTGRLSLTDRVSSDFPILRGTSFDRVRLIDLATHTAGGLPLQFPDTIATDDDAVTYYKRWKPSHASGTYRLYSNPSIMLLGLLTAQKMGADFPTLMRRAIFAPVGLNNTFLTVPEDQMKRYAQGYTSADVPRRMSSGPLFAEAYGIRTTADDLLRFTDANMGLLKLDAALKRAILETHVGYDRVGSMTQDLIWEQYRYPLALETWLRGNSEHMIFDENRMTSIRPPSAPRNDVVIDKTGSTNGFGAYVTFVPKQKIGIVLLANKSYPIDARVTAAYRILTTLIAKTAAV